MKNVREKPQFSLSGQVVHGKGNGKTVNMPTANLQINEVTQLPPLGVYASVVHIKEHDYPGVTNVGYRPSVGHEKRISVETFIIGYEGDLYGTFISVDLYHFLRPTQKMKSLQEVRRQVIIDCLNVKELLNGQ